MAKVKIITGGYNCGKTTTAMRIIGECAAKGQRTAGFVSEAEYSEGGKNAYYIRDLTGGRRELAVSLVKPEGSGWRRYDFSRFWFSDRALAFAGSILERIKDAEQADTDSVTADIVLIDELGPLESAGLGSFGAVKRFISDFKGTVILVIRETSLEDLAEKLEIDLNTAELIKPSR